jgi:hypothetical protein
MLWRVPTACREHAKRSRERPLPRLRDTDPRRSLSSVKLQGQPQVTLTSGPLADLDQARPPPVHFSG